MRRFLPVLLLAAAAAALPAAPSYYGLSGLAFLPWARTGPAGEHAAALSSAPAPFSTFTLYPFSARAYWAPVKGVEVALTNTYRYYALYPEPYGLFQLPGGGFIAATSNLVVPFLPSVKFCFEDRAIPNGSLAVGFEYPYGIFVASDYTVDLGAVGLQFVTGLSTTFAALYAFGGAEARLPLGFTASLEGSYGGMTANLTRPHEAFAAAGVRYAVTETLRFDFTFRMDQDFSRRLLFGLDVLF